MIRRLAVAMPFGGQLADFLRRKEILSTTNVRKVFNCGGFGGEALFLVVVGYTNNRTVAIVALVLAVGRIGGNLNQIARWLNRATQEGRNDLDALVVARRLLVVERQLALLLKEARRC